MLFNSHIFMLLFLPLLLAGWYFLNWKKKFQLAQGYLIGMSLWFYAYANLQYLWLLLFSCLIGWLLSCLPEKIFSEKGKKVLTGVGCVFHLGLLGYFKYSNFFLENLNTVFHTDFPMLQILLPVGISFYTFQIMAYVIDVYRGRIPAEQSLLRLGTYLTMFPQLISGPITNYADVRVALGRERTIKARQLEEGMKLLIIGLAAKVVIADRIGTLWNSIRMIGFDSISTKLAWMGAFAYSLQLYFDFAGYSMMARGIGKMLGFELPVNFRYPYISKSVTEFWRRWHITLGRWFREYVYIPLGGNRKGKARTFFNLFVVWSLTALWHGANYNFLIWGGILLCCLLVEKLFLLRLLDKSRVIGHLYVLFVVPLSWVAFAVTDLSELGVYMTRLFPFAGHAAGVINHLDYLKYLNDYAPLFLLGVLFATPLPETCYRLIERKWIGRVILLGIFGLCMYYLAVSANNPFLYFNF